MFNLFDLKESVKIIVALSDRRRKIHTIIEEMSREKQKCSRYINNSDGIYRSAGSSYIYTVGREIDDSGGHQLKFV